MKASSIFAASLLVAGAAFAGTTEVTNDLVIGVMPVPLEAGKKDAILSIPWIEAGTNTAVTAGVAVTNLVKTAGLTVNDELSWYNTGTRKYVKWRVADVAGVKQWSPMDAVSEKNIESLSSDSADLKRGQALVLTRNSNLNATNIYVVGQYTANSAGMTTFAKATVDEESKVSYTYTLAAPPQVGQIGAFPGYIELNSNTWSNVQSGDILITEFTTTGPIWFIRGKVNKSDSGYVWGTNKYEKISGTTYTRKVFDPNALIEIGKGFWYVSTGIEVDASVTWAIPPVTE